jgi:pyridoxamine 5'-phosphate oxidase
VADSVTTTPRQDFTQATDPFQVFEAWFADARQSEINDPNAMALATAGPGGLPNVRMVLLKGLDEHGHAGRGFVFYTNTASAKGQELAANPQAALLFHWKSLRRQVRIRGPIAAVTPAEADAYYATRPRGSRIGAWASTQSQPLDARSTLEASVARYERQFGDGDIPRPPHWSGYRLTPLEIELWHDQPYRLHDRLVFRRNRPDETWTSARLYP